jgi:hypothetical protein
MRAHFHGIRAAIVPPLFETAPQQSALRSFSLRRRPAKLREATVEPHAEVAALQLRNGLSTKTVRRLGVALVT